MCLGLFLFSCGSFWGLGVSFSTKTYKGGASMKKMLVF